MTAPSYFNTSSSFSSTAFGDNRRSKKSFNRETIPPEFSGLARQQVTTTFNHLVGSPFQAQAYSFLDTFKLNFVANKVMLRDCDDELYQLLRLFLQQFVSFHKGIYWRGLLFNRGQLSDDELNVCRARASCSAYRDVPAILQETMVSPDLLVSMLPQAAPNEPISLLHLFSQLQSGAGDPGKSLVMILMTLLEYIEKYSSDQAETAQALCRRIIARYKLNVMIKSKAKVDDENLDLRIRKRQQHIILWKSDNSKYILYESSPYQAINEKKHYLRRLLYYFIDAMVLLYSVGSGLMLCLLFASFFSWGWPILVPLGLATTIVTFYFYDANLRNFIKQAIRGFPGLKLWQKIAIGCSVVLGLLAGLAMAFFIKAVTASFIASLAASLSCPPVFAGIITGLFFVGALIVVTLAMVRLAMRLVSKSWIEGRIAHLTSIWRCDQSKQSKLSNVLHYTKALVVTGAYIFGAAISIAATTLAYSTHWFHVMLPVIHSGLSFIHISPLTEIATILYITLASPLKIIFNAEYAAGCASVLMDGILSAPKKVIDVVSHPLNSSELVATNIARYWHDPMLLVDTVVDSVIKVGKIIIGFGHAIAKLALTHGPIGESGSVLNVGSTVVGSGGTFFYEGNKGMLRFGLGVELTRNNTKKSEAFNSVSFRDPEHDAGYSSAQSLDSFGMLGSAARTRATALNSTVSRAPNRTMRRRY